MFVNDVKEKEPLPQSVEVLSHAAARAATFLVFAVMWTAFKWLRIVPRLALSILYSHAGCFLIVPMTQAILLRFNLTQLCGLRPTRKNCLVAMHFNLMQSRRLLRLILIFCNHTDCFYHAICSISILCGCNGYNNANYCFQRWDLFSILCLLYSYIIANTS